MKPHVNDQVLVELAALRDAEGRLQPEAVVDRARDPDSILNRFFEWDDSSAAEKFRLAQARHLIRATRIEVTVHDIKFKTVAYLKDPTVSGRKGGYLPMTEIAPRSDLAKECVLNELARVASALSRARLVANSLDIIDEIDALLASVTGLREDLHGATEEVPTEAAT